MVCAVCGDICVASLKRLVCRYLAYNAILSRGTRQAKGLEPPRATRSHQRSMGILSLSIDFPRCWLVCVPLLLRLNEGDVLISFGNHESVSTSQQTPAGKDGENIAYGGRMHDKSLVPQT